MARTSSSCKKNSIFCFKLSWVKLFFSGHQPYVCRFLKVLPLTRKIFGSAQILPQAKWENFPRPKKPPKNSTEISPATTGSFAWIFKVLPNHHSFGRARRASFHQCVSAFHQPRPQIPSCLKFPTWGLTQVLRTLVAGWWFHRPCKGFVINSCFRIYHGGMWWLEKWERPHRSSTSIFGT